jgi:hypothetical protein
MDTLGCAVCKSAAHNRAATADEANAFWRAKGIDGAAPEGMEVRSLIHCLKLINMRGRKACDCETAWVRNSPDEEWRPIVRIPSDFVASVSG